MLQKKDYQQQTPTINNATKEEIPTTTTPTIKNATKEGLPTIPTQQ